MAGVEDKGKKIPVICYHLGMIYLKLEEKEKARGYLELAVKSKAPFSGKDDAEKALKNL